MYSDVITVFNDHKGIWYPSIIRDCDVGISTVKGHSTQGGIPNEDSVIILVPCLEDKAIVTDSGLAEFLDPKAYGECEDPSGTITFSPEHDFIFVGEWDEGPVADEDYELGFYQEMNDVKDNIYMISSASFYGLIPHFELGGR